jgi:hypothetical protein
MSSFNRRMFNGIGDSVIPQWLLKMGAVGQKEAGTNRSKLGGIEGMYSESRRGGYT